MNHPENRHKFNEAKYKILSILEDNKRNFRGYLTPRQISEITGIGLCAIKVHLTRLYRLGYIWRLENPGNRFRKSHYLYGFPKDKGSRIWERYNEYKKIENVTGVKIPLKWYVLEPPEILMARHKYKKIMDIK